MELLILYARVQFYTPQASDYHLISKTVEPETSSLFWLDTSVDIAITGQLYDKSISTGLFLAKNFVLRFFIFAYRGHLQVLKVCDLKLLFSESIVWFKRPKIKVGF